MKTENQIRNEMIKLRVDLTEVRDEIEYLINSTDIELFRRDIISLRAKENFILGQLGFATWIINK